MPVFMATPPTSQKFNSLKGHYMKSGENYTSTYSTPQVFCLSHHSVLVYLNTLQCQFISSSYSIGLSHLTVLVYLIILQCQFISSSYSVSLSHHLTVLVYLIIFQCLFLALPFQYVNPVSTKMMFNIQSVKLYQNVKSGGFGQNRKKNITDLLQLLTKYSTYQSDHRENKRLTGLAIMKINKNK